MDDLPHSAVPSALGYYFQGLFALVVLLDSSDGGAVSVETADDVVRHDGLTSLFQLKHSTGNPKPLTIKNDGFWNTLGIWSPGPFDGSLRFVFVTCAKISTGSELACLTVANSDRDGLRQALDHEANRVSAARLTAKTAGRKLPYEDRAAGCQDYLGLSPDDRKRLLDLIEIVPTSFSAATAPGEVEKRLQSVLLPSVRGQVVERLIEWWDRRVALSLIKKRSREIYKSELQSKLHDLFVEHSAQGLPDDFSGREPDSIEAETGRIMAKQIEWVRGGPSRLRRAVVARWRARNQRGAWLEDDISIASDLDEFDKELIEVWGGRHGPMVDDCEGIEGPERCTRGLAILEWSHHDAHRDVPPLRPTWSQAYLVQGSLQQLAEQEKVGWHPDFETLLRALREAG